MSALVSLCCEADVKIESGNVCKCIACGLQCQFKFMEEPKEDDYGDD